MAVAPVGRLCIGGVMRAKVLVDDAATHKVSYVIAVDLLVGQWRRCHHSSAHHGEHEPAHQISLQPGWLAAVDRTVVQYISTNGSIPHTFYACCRTPKWQPGHFSRLISSQGLGLYAGEWVSSTRPLTLHTTHYMVFCGTLSRLKCSTCHM